MAKKKTTKKEKKGVAGELTDLAKILSGEMALREKEELLEEKKKKNKSRRRKKLLESIENQEVELEKDKENPKVVQNIKLFEWESPIRTKVVFERKSFLTFVLGTLLFIVFLAILQKYLLMLAIISLLFFIYVAGTTEPEIVKHQIRARGIEAFDNFYEWFMLDEFFFSNKNGQELLLIDTKLRYPGRLIMLIDKKDRGALFMLLQDKLLYKDIKAQSSLEKATYGRYIPLDDV